MAKEMSLEEIRKEIGMDDPAYTKGSQNYKLIESMTTRECKLWLALDEADTAFAVLNTVDLDDNPQARAALVRAWKMIQDTKAEILGPNSIYAEAVRISREKS